MRRHGVKGAPDWYLNHLEHCEYALRLALSLARTHRRDRPARRSYLRDALRLRGYATYARSKLA
jgi:hypothetical protein